MYAFRSRPPVLTQICPWWGRRRPYLHPGNLASFPSSRIGCLDAPIKGVTSLNLVRHLTHFLLLIQPVSMPSFKASLKVMLLFPPFSPRSLASFRQQNATPLIHMQDEPRPPFLFLSRLENKPWNILIITTLRPQRRVRKR